MEKYVELLSNITESDINKISDNFLNKYYNIIKHYGAKELNREKLFKIFEEIKKEYGLKNELYLEPEFIKNSISSILFAGDISDMKLIPLITYLDKNNIIYKYLLEKGIFDNSYVILSRIIKKFNITSNVASLSDLDYEKDLYLSYQEGIIGKNFSDIYKFITALEYGRGFNFSKLINFSIFILSEIFFDDLVKVFNRKNDTVKIIYLINNLSIEKKLKLAHKSDNILLKFEITRDLLYMKHNKILCNNYLYDKEREELIQIILSLSENEGIWKQFLDFFITHPIRSPQLFILLNKVIENLSGDRLDNFLDSIDISRYQNIDSQHLLNLSLFNIDSSELQEKILKILFNKWIFFIDNYNDYFGKIILTDIIDIVSFYSMNFLEKNDMNIAVIQLLENIKGLDNIWFKDSLEQQNYLYKQVSKLFIYGFAINKYKLDSLKEEISSVCEKIFILKYEHKSTDVKTTLQFFNEYILKNNEMVKYE